MSQTITADDDGETTRSGTIAVASGDVITISSSEGNTNECNTDPGNTTRTLCICLLHLTYECSNFQLSIATFKIRKIQLLKRLNCWIQILKAC